MKIKSQLNPLVVAVSAALVTGGYGISVANADENPFELTELSSGYMVADAQGATEDGTTEEGKTEEGKCGEGKCGEGKCGGQDADEGAADESKTGEGKCGEGKCGGS
ncbi:MAG: hypothetical protein OXC42_03330 [Gammaproteobacteria bacterium]|nr:hypothetical protein [Gammaproteobacteria bacterium]